MRRPKKALKICFYIIITCIVIFGFNLRVKNNLKSNREPNRVDSISQQQQQRQRQHKATNDINGEASPATVLEQVQQLQELEPEEEAAAYTLAEGLATVKPWFFRNGEYYPKPTKTFSNRRHAPKLFPQQDQYSDRVVNQLMYVPHNYEQIKASGKLKTILLYNNIKEWNITEGRKVFLRSKCPVDTCTLTSNRDLASVADMILYRDTYIPTGKRRPNNNRQVNMMYYLECPYETDNVQVPDAINWTATYRRDSTVMAPYGNWQYYDNKVQQKEQDQNYALNKTKKVAWFVSNCGSRNGRPQYAQELLKYIEVDIYGGCGSKKCPRSMGDKCFDILDKHYKFYLAFENSNCRDYITEKFFVNALNHKVLPIVMGARPEDYEVSAPRRSYIHIDEFASPKELAEYLHILDKDDELYNSYFKWKGTGEFINTYFWCRVCSTLHNEDQLRKPSWYTDINDWWRGVGTCTWGSWNRIKRKFAKLSASSNFPNDL